MKDTFNPIDLDQDEVWPRLDVAKMVFVLALKNTLPQAAPLFAEHEGFCFRSVFSFKGPLPPLFLTLMQEEMRRIKKEELPLKMQEMLRSNAATFLRHHGFAERADLLQEEGEEEVIPLIRLGDYLDEMFSEHILETSFDMGVVQLLSLEPGEEGTFEVLGTAFGDEKEAKAFLKLYKEESKRKEQEIWSREGMIISPKALEKRDQLMLDVRSAWKEFRFQEVGLLSDEEDGQSAKIATLYPKGAYWMGMTKDEAVLFCPAGREATELHHLEQFISSWLEKKKPCPYEKIEEKGKIEWFLIDRLGVRHPGPVIELKKREGFIQASLIGQLSSWLSV